VALDGDEHYDVVEADLDVVKERVRAAVTR
jgi:hypothetical protein